MTRDQVWAYLQLLTTAGQLAAAPAQLATGLDLLEEPHPDGPVDTVIVAASDLPPIVEPSHIAINGFIRVHRVDGRSMDYYVGHDPRFIADQLMKAKDAGVPIYCYWDKPGHRDAKQVLIATAIIDRVTPRLLEADIDSLYEDFETWAL